VSYIATISATLKFSIADCKPCSRDEFLLYQQQYGTSHFSGVLAEDLEYMQDRQHMLEDMSPLQLIHTSRAGLCKRKKHTEVWQETVAGAVLYIVYTVNIPTFYIYTGV